MSNIQSKAVNVPSFQAASGKGDGQGNGSGGMYFGSEGEYEEEYTNFNFGGNWDSVGTKDIPFFLPLIGKTPSAMASWKIALAKELYQHMKDQPVEAEEIPTQEAV